MAQTSSRSQCSGVLLPEGVSLQMSNPSAQLVPEGSCAMSGSP